ncbi:MAG: methylated-DNA--[protein]-cysteine S-methyltransferase [Bacteroidales bacterium]
MEYSRFKIKDIEFAAFGDYNGLQMLSIYNRDNDINLSEKYTYSPQLFSELENQLREYFEGTRSEFDLKLNPQGTEFQKKVWRSLLEIPYGESKSYKDIAIEINNPKAVRAVGGANNKNPIPIIIPCHRVIGANGNLTGYAYGLDMKNYLLNHELINYVFCKLNYEYGDLSWWPADSPFEVMVGAILGQNTSWTNVEKALANFKGKLNPEFIESIDIDALAQIIRPSGYYKQKAKKLKAFCSWFAKYNFQEEKVAIKDTEILRQELLNVYGVGPETADSIQLYAFNKATFVIDTYTRRIFSRIGLVVPKLYDDFRNLMQKHIKLDANIYNQYHGLIVEHAKRYCTKKPKCKECPLYTFCKKQLL